MNLNDFNAVTINQMETSEIFYSMPKVLFEDEAYKNLRLDAKVLYSILKDRLKLSAKNGWIDDKGRVYLEYSNNNLVELLGCSKPTVIKIKKNLLDHGLIFEEFQFTKADGQIANRIYVGNVIEFDAEKYRELRQKRQEENFQKHQTDIDRAEKEKLLGASKKFTGAVNELDTNNNNSNNINSINNLEISSRKAESNSDEFSQPAGADNQSTDDVSAPYVKPQYYSLLQPIADAYNERCFGFPDWWTMTHRQKMLIGDHLQDGYVLSHEVIAMIEQIPQESSSPFAYLMSCLNNLKEERLLEAKIHAHRMAKERYREIS